MIQRAHGCRERAWRYRQVATAVVLAFGMTFAPASAQTSWDSLLGGDWEDGANWTSGVPTGATLTTIDILGLGPTLEGNGTTANLIVGETLTGPTLTIQNGGTLGSSAAFLGTGAGSSGTVTLVDADSSWSLKNLYLGGTSTSAAGIGRLYINSGSSVAVDAEFRFWPDGLLSIDGGSLEVQDFIDSGGEVEFVDGEITVSGGIFRHRTGEDFVIDSGAAGKTANWVLDGVTNDPEFDSITVGRGTLSLTGGSEATTTAGVTLGNGDSSTSGISVTGANTSLGVGGAFEMSGGSLSVTDGGALSASSLSSENGGLIDVTSGSLSIDNAFESSGDLNLDVIGSNLSTGTFRMAQGSLILNGDGADVKWENSGEVRFGHLIPEDQDDKLFFQIDDIEIETGEAIVGDRHRAFGGLVGGAMWTASSFVFGNEGFGGITTGSFQSAGYLVTPGDMVLGANEDGDGEVIIRSNGSNAQVGGNLIVGDAGQGQLDISRSGSVDVTGNLIIGVTSTRLNRVEVDFGGQLDVGGDLIIGDDGDGRLEIVSTSEGAATVTTGSALIGLKVGGSGEALLSGDDATWTSNGTFNVGVNGEGLLTVENGALLETGSSALGALAGSSGEATISGDSTVWLSAALEVARFGEGVMEISEGAQVQSTSADIAADAGSVGTVTVEDAGSGWTVSNDLYIGGKTDGPGGDGTLRIDDGATVTAGSTIILAGGTLTGNGGSLISDVVSSGVVAPGESPGVLTVDGDFSLTSGGSISLEIDGLAAGTQYDQFVVTGTMDLSGGTISLDFTEFSGVADGDLFEFFPGQNLTGQTLTVSTFGLAPNLAIDTSTFATTGTFGVVPEVSSLALLLIAAAVFALMGRRRRTARSD